MTTGVATRYNGVQFRSRLEARWAVMWDLLGWRWEYEPFDLNGWIPDFALIGCGGGINVLVEVKPVTTPDERTESKMLSSEFDEQPMMIVGCAVPAGERSDLETFQQIGWWVHPYRTDASVIKYAEGFFDLASEDGDWQGWMHGSHPKHEKVARPGPSMRDFWVRAGNAVQWKAPRATHNIARGAR